MSDHRGYRRRLVGWGRLAGASCAAGLVLGLGSAAALAAGQLGPVSPKVLAVLNANGKQFVPPHHHARPTVDKQAAVQFALSGAPWRGCATGVSLMRTTKLSEPSAPGSLVWLISVHPDRPVGPVSGGPAHHAHARHVANYFVVAVSAKSGRFQAQDGHSPKLPPWRPARPSRCQAG